MFEIASKATGLNVAVLPYAAASNSDRWILKMHGCASHPEDIVLTREDYLRYATRRSALQGIVQSLLITRHMLFVGFSLQDDNFHRIVDEVRRAIRSTSIASNSISNGSSNGNGNGGATTPESESSSNTSPSTGSNTSSLNVTTPNINSNGMYQFGTSLILIRNRIVDMLWKDDLHMVAMQEDPKGTLSTSFIATEGSPTPTASSNSTPNASPSQPQRKPPRTQAHFENSNNSNENNSNNNNSNNKDAPISGGMSNFLPRRASLPSSNNSISVSARRLDIFLDYLSAEASTTAAYLLQPQYDVLLTDEQRALRKLITEFVDNASSKAKNADEWYIVCNMVKSLGGEELIKKKPAQSASQSSNKQK